MTWKPIQPFHAIESVRIAVRLRDPLPAKLVRSIAADNDMRRLELGFTSKNTREGHNLTINRSGAPVGSPTEITGWDWQRLSPANTLVETFVLENDLIVYETKNYTNWQDLYARFHEVSAPILNNILTFFDASSMSLEYVDRFIFDGPTTEAAPNFMVDEIFTLLPENVSNGASTWHVHRGWFEDVADGKLLINQNLNAHDMDDDAGNVLRSIFFVTKTELRPESLSVDFDVFMKELPSMHGRSIEVFKSVLKTEMLSKVGLKRG